MTELINISTNAQGASVVSARELYAFLEVKSRFNDWIKNRIDQYDFVANQDYTSLTKNLVSGGNEVDYVLTLDMAKELSMVERNAKGKQARQYFIDCEKKLHGYDLRTLNTINRYLTPLLTDQQRQINTLHDEVNRLVRLVEQVARKQPVGGSILHQADTGRATGQIVLPASQNGPSIGIPPYRPAHPRTGVDMCTPGHVAKQYEYIQRLRRQGYKGAELASKMGLSKGQVSKIESRFRSISYRPAHCINLIVPSVRLYPHTCKN